MADFFVEGLGRTPPGPHNPLAWEVLFSHAIDNDAVWTIPEAFFYIVFAAATCDAELDGLEREELLAVAHRSRALQSLTIADLDAVRATAASRKTEDPNRALRDACAALEPDMRASVFAHAVDLVLCDGALSPIEARFLNDLAQALALDAAEIRRIAEVLVVKNQY